MPLALSTDSMVSVAYTRPVSSCFPVPNQYNCIENEGTTLSPVLKTCNLSTQRAKAGESQVQTYPGLHGEFQTSLDYTLITSMLFFLPQ